MPNFASAESVLPSMTLPKLIGGVAERSVYFSGTGCPIVFEFNRSIPYAKRINEFIRHMNEWELNSFTERFFDLWLFSAEYEEIGNIFAGQADEIIKATPKKLTLTRDSKQLQGWAKEIGGILNGDRYRNLLFTIGSSCCDNVQDVLQGIEEMANLRGMTMHSISSRVHHVNEICFT